MIVTSGANIGGMTYAESCGIRSLDMNTEDYDSALIFYLNENNGGSKARRVLMKFANKCSRERLFRD